MKTVNLFRIEIRRIKSNIYHQNLPLMANIGLEGTERLLPLSSAGSRP